MTGKARASLQRLAHNAGPIAVLGMFVLLAVVVYQQTTIVGLQKAQAESSKNGRATLAQIASLAEQVKTLVQQGNSFTDPNSPISKEQQAKVAGYLSSLAMANQAALNDQTAKIAQMFEQCHSLPCAVATVSRILAQPVPVPTFAGMASVTPAPSAPVPTPSSTPTVRATVTPRPSPTPAPTLTPFLQVQCPIICPSH